MSVRLGILGGTFDPVHLGHLRAAQEALDSLALDEMLFVPAAVPPHKTRKILDFDSRWRMLQIALKGNPRFRLSDVERRMSGKSYTARSLKKLREENPDSKLFFLVGLDAFFEMDTWFHFREIFRLADIAVLCRPVCDEEKILEFLSQKVSDLYRIDSQSREIWHPELCSVHRLHNTRMDISSTMIRELAAEGLSARYLVPDEVWSYISGCELYRRNNDA
jgi:nicotinate-nucleotide adenylyltransferase